jgi:hypothetical protein
MALRGRQSVSNLSHNLFPLKPLSNTCNARTLGRQQAALAKAAASCRTPKSGLPGVLGVRFYAYRISHGVLRAVASLSRCNSLFMVEGTHLAHMLRVDEDTMLFTKTRELRHLALYTI